MMVSPVSLIVVCLWQPRGAIEVFDRCCRIPIGISPTDVTRHLLAVEGIKPHCLEFP
jgi:hypothetical protein